jgi:hypothetical protein
VSNVHHGLPAGETVLYHTIRENLGILKKSEKNRFAFLHFTNGLKRKLLGDAGKSQFGNFQ